MKRNTLAATFALLACVITTQVAEARGPKKARQNKEDAAEQVAPTVEPGAEAASDAPAIDVPAEDPKPGDLWTFVSRLEGEVPTEAAVEAVKEREEAIQTEGALINVLGGVDVPRDFYADPSTALAIDPLHLDKIDPDEFDIPVTVNDDVVKWMKYFTGAGRKHYQRYLARATRYRPEMYRQLEAKGLPRDLVYLSMIESGYNAFAYSSADAAGLWQFIPSTGRLYKLRIDFWLDERRDPARSTEAALWFLSDLHEMFGDWNLAFASYNGGPGRVQRAIQKAGSKDFWTLAHGSYLHTETDNYVPKIMAAAIIGHHPERYGFNDIPYQDELKYDVAKVEAGVDVDTIARAASVPSTVIQDLNPALRRFVTPPGGYDVRIPVGQSETFMAALAALPKVERVVTAESSHRVRKGDTLASIGKKYGKSAWDIARANNLKSVNRIYVGMNLMIPGRSEVVAKRAPEDVQVASASESRSDAPVISSLNAPSEHTPEARPEPTRRKATSHTVRRGDTLSGVAARYGVSTSQIKSWNHLKGSTILVGQRLVVSSSEAVADDAPRGEAPASKPSSSKGSSKASSGKYTVRKGDTLASIADKLGVSQADLQKWNHLKNPSAIQYGQVLVTKAGAEKSASGVTYKVRAGDSLTDIANRYGCTVADLKAWNKLRSSVIRPGQTLRILK
jgi:membrane-bound lytic murein transglycosylase D